MATQEQQVSRIVVEFDPGVAPVSGQLVPAAGAPRAFVGWLELTRALEAIISDAPPTAAPRPTRPAR